MSTAAPSKGRPHTNKHTAQCTRCTIQLEPGDGALYYNPLRVVCPACLLREDVQDDNGFLERLAQLPLVKDDGTQLDLLGFQKADCRRISTTRALLIGSQMGTGKCLISKDLCVSNGLLISAEDMWSEYCVDDRVTLDGEGEWSPVCACVYVPALDDRTGRMTQARVIRLYRQRVSEVLRRVRLRDGSAVTITRAHKLRGPLKWSNDLCGPEIQFSWDRSRVCVPAKLPHESGVLDLRVAELFGWAIGDGSERSGPVSMFLTQKDRSVLERCESLAAEIIRDRGLAGVALRWYEPRQTHRAPDLVITAPSWRAFCESHDYPWGTLSAERRVPAPIMQGNAEVVRTFLRAYFDADGSVPSGCRYVEYSSASQRLVKEVSTLLRRFGVWVTIRKKRARATNSPDCPYRDYWVGSFAGPSARRFRDEVGFGVDHKQAELAALCAIKANTNTEGVPASELIAGAVRRSGLPASWFGLDPKNGLSTVYLRGTQEFARGSLQVVVDHMDRILSGQAAEEFFNQPRPRNEKKIRAALEALDWDDLQRVRDQAQRLIDQEVHYPLIESVEEFHYEGWVYDFEVEDHHNYVAEGVLCHNTVQAAMAALRKDSPNFVFSPASVRENWFDEIKRWRPDLHLHVAEGQKDFANDFQTILESPGHVLIGSFGVLPGAPCAGCKGLRARLQELRKWKVWVCEKCDKPDRPPSAKSTDNKTCLQCKAPTLKLPAPRYHSRWYPQCNHHPDLNGRPTPHPPYVDLTIQGMRLRLPYHPGTDVEEWLRSAVRLPERGRVPDFDQLAPHNDCIRCFGCEQTNPILPIHNRVVLVADECHAFKNPSNIRTRCWRRLRQAVWDAGGYVFGLSGTPCEGKPLEFWNVLDSLGLARAAFMHWNNYRRIFTHWFENPKGERNPPQGPLRDELHARLRRVQINRRRKDVLSQLPPRQEVRIHVDINQKTIHDVNEAVHRMLAVKRAFEDVQHGNVTHNGARLFDPFDPNIEDAERARRRGIYESRVSYYFKERPWNEDEEIQGAVDQALTSKGKMPTIDQLSRIRSMLSQAKVAAVQQWIADREAEDEPAIVFSQHVSILKKVAGSRPGWECFHGGLTAKKRSALVKSFQAADKNVRNGLCVSIKAGGEGITLTRAAVCAFVDLSFNPAKNAQSESRLIRIGAEQHKDTAAQAAWDRVQRGDFAGCDPAEPCRQDGTSSVVPCLQHQARITVVRFVAKHVVDRLVMDTLEEKEALLDALEWEEPEYE